VFGQVIIEKNLIDMNSIDMSEMGFDDQTAAAIKAVLERILYARVDVVVVDNPNLNSTQKKRVLLMELEVIDPELYFKIVPETSEKFADALVGLLHQRS
jgi:2-phospho-L-lactate transferase/gluconeogenesis factor (CofD/UPF0052 family)